MTNIKIRHLLLDEIMLSSCCHLLSRQDLQPEP